MAPDLIARVDAAIQALGSVPDPAARALGSGHGSHVAVLIPLLSNALFVDLLEALQLRLRRAGYQTLIRVTHYDAEEEEQLLKEQLAHRPAGLIVTGFDRIESASTPTEGANDQPVYAAAPRGTNPELAGIPNLKQKKGFAAIFIAANPYWMAERTGLEPATPGVTGRYSNQLNYHSW